MHPEHEITFRTRTKWIKIGLYYIVIRTATSHRVTGREGLIRTLVPATFHRGRFFYNYYYYLLFFFQSNPYDITSGAHYALKSKTIIRT